MSLSNRGLPPQAVPVNVTVSGANAQLVATMPALPGWLNILVGYKITGSGATAATTIDVTCTGAPVGENPISRLTVPAGVNANAANTAWSPEWRFGIAASGPNIELAITVPPFGAGNTGAAINLYGYRVPA